MPFDGMEQLRTEFRKTFEVYTREGHRMADLLLTRESESVDNFRAIAEQQQRLTYAQQLYDEARLRYIRAVLPPCVLNGVSNQLTRLTAF